MAALCAAGFLGVLYLKYRWGGRSGVDRMARAQRQQTKAMREQYDWQRQQAAGMAGQAGAAVGYHARRTYRSLLVPAAIFVAAIPLLGMYVASAAYIFAVLAIPRHQSVLRSAVMAAATALALYVVFERMFQVSLPHGALGDVIGF